MAPSDTIQSINLTINLLSSDMKPPHTLTPNKRLIRPSSQQCSLQMIWTTEMQKQGSHYSADGIGFVNSYY